jgi:hypothetical protein
MNIHTQQEAHHSKHNSWLHIHLVVLFRLNNELRAQYRKLPQNDALSDVQGNARLKHQFRKLLGILVYSFMCP